MKLTNKLLIATALYVFATTAQAAASYCSAGDPNTDGLSTSDMTFEGSNSNDCYGVVSGNDGEDPTVIDAIWSGDPWQFLAKDDAPGSGTDTGTIDGVQFTLAADAGSSGNWTLSWVEISPPDGLPITMDLVGVLKSQTAYAAYLFKNLTFDVDPASGTGTFTIAFCVVGNCNNFPDLSHLSLYARIGDTPPPPPPPPPPTGGVPEPGVLALFGVGLLGLGVTRRHRKQA